jgi:hypothetical protein
MVYFVLLLFIASITLVHLKCLSRQKVTQMDTWRHDGMSPHPKPIKPKPIVCVYPEYVTHILNKSF